MSATPGERPVRPRDIRRNARPNLRQRWGQFAENIEPGWLLCRTIVNKFGFQLGLCGPGEFRASQAGLWLYRAHATGARTSTKCSRRKGSQEEPKTGDLGHLA